MNPYITVMTPFTVAGRTLRQKSSTVKHHADIPAFVFGVNSREAEVTALCPTQEEFAKSDAIKHCEISMIYDVDPNSGAFTYFLGRGIFHPDDLNALKTIPSDMVSMEISGLYAVFSTPPTVPFDQHDQFAKIIQETWNDIFTEWLPNSEFEYDETRKDYEFYDYRDHGWYFENKRQMDICIPIRQREEAKRKSQEKGEILWAREMKRREQR
jgi:AraC family transcriptional regulator